MRPARVVAIVVAALVALPALGLLIGGGVLTGAYAIERDDDGYFDKTLERLSSSTAVITAGDVDLRSDPGPPEWLLDLADFSVRLQVTSPVPSGDLFVGIGPTERVDSYLAGVARDEIREVDADGDVRYDRRDGTAAASPPLEQDFWVASVSGSGSQTLFWDVDEGEWAAVLMNADGSTGVTAEVTVGVRSGVLLGLAVGMLIIGVLLTAGVVTAIVFAVRRRPAPEPPSEELPVEAAVMIAEVEAPFEPVRLEATLDEPLSPWKWLVKWFLAIPHFIVLAFLWIAFAVLTVVAFFSILFTRRYPPGIFEFNVGVLRWTWRVMYYAASGGLGTDRYPPFSLERLPDYPATLDIDYPEELSRGLVLVKWWLLAIPHYLVVAIIAGAGWWFSDIGAGGLVGLLTLIAAVILLFTERYPRPLFDLIIGLNRWAYRVTAYAALMTDRYPPFRLDQGGKEPDRE